MVAAMNPERLQVLKGGEVGQGPVLYWMHRDHRINDNQGLAHAQELALGRGKQLMAAWFLADGYPGAKHRHYAFLLKGMAEVEQGLAKKSIPLLLYQGEPEEALPRMLAEMSPGLVVTDFDPLRIKQSWVELLVHAASCPVYEVDSRNLVPCRAVSDKKEYAARTIRPKIHRRLDEFLSPIPSIVTHPHNQGLACPSRDWEDLLRSMKVDRSVGPVDWESGEAAAHGYLERFLERGLKGYGQERNDPNHNAQSGLSPYLHFGMLSPKGAVLGALARRRLHPESVDNFIEELVVRRELADNFCLYEPLYDRVDGFPDWARKTLDKHRADPRPWSYQREELEQGLTHDPLWNAAQLEMRETGKMHGYLRMYWAKKILEWTESAEQAMALAVEFNDHWSLDGRDSNGYTGAAWSIGGVHDRPWKERPVFGTIRYMSYNGAKRKFDVARYVKRMYDLAGRERPEL